MCSEIVPALPNPLLGLVFSLSDEETLKELRDSQFKDIVQKVDITQLTKKMLTVFYRLWPTESPIPDETPLSNEDYWNSGIWKTEDSVSCKGSVGSFVIKEFYKIKLLPFNHDHANTVFNFVSLLPAKKKEERDNLIDRLVHEILFSLSIRSWEFVRTKVELEQVIAIANKIQDNLTRKDFYTIFVGKFLDPIIFSEDLLNLCHSYKKEDIFRNLSFNSLVRAEIVLLKGENPEQYLAFFDYFIKQTPDEMAEIIKKFFDMFIPRERFEFPKSLEQIECDLKRDLFFILLIKKITTRFDQFLCIRSIIRPHSCRWRRCHQSKLLKAALNLESNEFSIPVHSLSQENFIEIEGFIRHAYELLTKLYTIGMHIEEKNYEAIFTLLLNNIKNVDDYYDLFSYFIDKFRLQFRLDRVDSRLLFIQRILDRTKLDLICKNHKHFSSFLRDKFVILFGWFSSTSQLIEEISKIKGNNHFKELIITELKSRKS